LGIDWKAQLNSNKGYFAEHGQGLGGMIEISKTLETKLFSFTPFFRYFINDPSVNENETVFGISAKAPLF
jgi:hypothetical protein